MQVCEKYGLLALPKFNTRLLVGVFDYATYLPSSSLQVGIHAKLGSSLNLSFLQQGTQIRGPNPFKPFRVCGLRVRGLRV